MFITATIIKTVTIIATATIIPTATIIWTVTIFQQLTGVRIYSMNEKKSSPQLVKRSLQTAENIDCQYANGKIIKVITNIILYTTFQVYELFC